MRCRILVHIYTASSPQPPQRPAVHATGALKHVASMRCSIRKGMLRIVGALIQPMACIVTYPCMGFLLSERLPHAMADSGTGLTYFPAHRLLSGSLLPCYSNSHITGRPAASWRLHNASQWISQNGLIFPQLTPVSQRYVSALALLSIPFSSSCRALQDSGTHEYGSNGAGHSRWYLTPRDSRVGSGVFWA